MGWPLACHSRKMLRFQTEEPLFLSPPAPVPARLTQPFTWIRFEHCANNVNSQLITHLMERPTQGKMHIQMQIHCQNNAEHTDNCCLLPNSYSNPFFFISLEVPAGSGWSSQQVCFSGRGSVEERACSWGRTLGPAQRWDVWSVAARSFLTGDTAWRAPPLLWNNTSQGRNTTSPGLCSHVICKCLAFSSWRQTHKCYL